MESIQIKNCILDREAIQRKLRRIALQIAEQNADEKELYVAGIKGNGEVVARNLVKHLQAVAEFIIHPVTIEMDKNNPVQARIAGTPDFSNKTIIVTDDVANTGRILLYAFLPFLATAPRQLQTMVLVERSHKLFPVQNNYVGLSLSTTLQEHIQVETNGDELTGAWLF